MLVISAISLSKRTLFARLLLAVGAAQIGLSAPPLRVLTPQDLFRLEKLDETTASPDGKLLAFVLIRSKTTASIHMSDFMEGMDRADIWVVPVKSGPPTRITNGATDGSGFFLPAWSPDGARLAMLSTRGRNVSLWVWEKTSRTLRQISESTLDISRPAWLASEVVLCASVPVGEQPWKFAIETKGPEQAMRVWPRAWKGRVSTASVLQSGLAIDSQIRPQGRLLKFDLSKHTEQSIHSGNFSSIAVSPNGRAIAMLKEIGPLKPKLDQLIPYRNPKKFVLVVINADGKPLPETDWSIEDPVPGSIRWSRDGTLAMRTQRTSGQPDWQTLNGSSRNNLTSALRTPPDTLVQGPKSGSFAAVSDGHVWLLKTDGSAPAALSIEINTKIDAIVWPTGNTSRPQSPWIVVTAAQALYAIDLSTGAFYILHKPSDAAEFIGFVPATGTAFFSESTRRGTYLRSSTRGVSALRTIFATNEFLQQIAEARLKRIEYVGLDGQKLTGWLLLPTEYQQGRRYPTVVWVYAGDNYSDNSPPFWVSLNSSSTFNLQLLAAHGYAVLMPSMPLKPEGIASDPYQDLPNGVLPAIDKAIEAGVADPERLAVAGHSFGGYSVHGLITQTNRFHAAISLAGFANLVSLYGALDARSRYDDFAREHLLHMIYAESGQFRMGNPPWKDMDRYIRNSPITYADRVSTPLMIVQGDLDYVPIQQGEEFFTALYRQNKPADFVRYLGEGHIIESPANIADLWNRIYAWLDRYLNSSRQQN